MATSTPGLPKLDHHWHPKLLKRMAEIKKATEGLYSDPAACALPHPIRVKCTEMLHPETLLPSIGEEYTPRLEQMFRDGIGTQYMWHLLDRANLEGFKLYMHRAAQGADGGYNTGMAGAMFHALRYHFAGGRMFTLDEHLVELLSHTDIDLDIPLADVKVPFPNIYVQFGTRRDPVPYKDRIHNKISGDHVVEGAYVSLATGESGMPVLEVTVTGSPVGKSGDLADDTVEWISMDMADPERTVEQALRDAFRQGQVMFEGTDRPLRVRLGDDADIRPYENAALPRMRSVLKALLYISMPSVRKETHTDHTEAAKAAARAVSGAHKRKALKKAAKTYDTIYILPPTEAGDATPGAGFEIDDNTRTVKTHWRRGHFKTQRYGKAYAERRTIWIKPVLVNAEHLGGSGTGPAKQYTVK